MAKVGLKDTLALLAKGYSKKEIDALAAVDEENEKKQVVPSEPPKEPEPVPADPPAAAPAPVPDDKKEPEPDYKKLYEEQLQKTKEAEEKTKKLQQNNVHANSAGTADDAKNKEQDALTNLVRSFM